eukprot:2075363-Pleurochrysis_carterae.AAC.2
MATFTVSFLVTADPSRLEAARAPAAYCTGHVGTHSHLHGRARDGLAIERAGLRAVHPLTIPSAYFHAWPGRTGRTSIE